MTGMKKYSLARMNILLEVKLGPMILGLDLMLVELLQLRQYSELHDHEWLFIYSLKLKFTIMLK